MKLLCRFSHPAISILPIKVIASASNLAISEAGGGTPKIGRKKPKAVELLSGDGLIFQT